MDGQNIITFGVAIASGNGEKAIGFDDGRGTQGIWVPISWKTEVNETNVAVSYVWNLYTKYVGPSYMFIILFVHLKYVVIKKKSRSMVSSLDAH